MSLIMKRFPALVPCLAALAMAPAAISAATPEAVKRPNVLIVITDDQGYGDLSLHGNPHLRTPHIDRLGETGVRFDRFFVNSFCAPTRAALLTGRWPLRTGCHGVTHNREAMRAAEVTIAEALEAAGYRTACIGKWHNGGQYPLTAQGQGFAEFFGFNGGHCNDYLDPVLLRGARPEATRGYVTDVLTDEAVRFISARGDEPFFCYLSYNAPHSPYQVPDRYFERFAALGFEPKVAAFYGMCENIDDNVGRLLAQLEAEGIAADTIVVFLTDNGGTAGVKLYNAGMRGGKTSLHEGGSRVPLFVRWPAAGWQPHLVDTIVAHVDLYPTLLDLCGVAPPAGPLIDGRSLRPLLEEGDAAAWPERTLFIHNPINETNKYPGAVRTPRHRLVREIPGARGGSNAKADDAGATPWQLYDMEADPGERHDIAAEQPAVVAELAARYDAWFADIARDRLGRQPLPVGHAEHDPVELHAPQAFFDPPLHFAAGPGFANDWLTGWTDAAAKVWYELDVARAGDYEVGIAYGCPPADTGARLRVAAAGSAAEAVVPAAEAPEIPLPHRDELGLRKYRNRDWAELALGTLTLPQGAVRLALEPLAMPGGQVMDLKHVVLRRRGPAVAQRLPRVLLIGDHGWGKRSPAGATGYAAAVAERLAGRAEVVRSPESGATTAKALAGLDGWLGDEPWDVIHFSFGLHDVKRDAAGEPAVPLAAFERNLAVITDRLTATGAALVWASATPVPEGREGRRPADVVAFNEAARRIMERRGIPINDLHAAALPRLEEWQLPGTPHFSVAGAAGLAEHVVAAIEPALPAAGARASATAGREVRHEAALDAFLGEPAFAVQPLWSGRGGTSIVTATDGTAIAFQAMRSDKVRRSEDGGRTWGGEIAMGSAAHFGNALVDETSGDVLYLNPRAGWVMRSRDQGRTWAREAITALEPDGFGLVPTTVSSMQPGITLGHGERPGRLVMPARVQGPKETNDVPWRPYHYSTAVLSDDGGRSWQTSHPFPVLGTGEGAIVELSDGSLLYNSREHMSPGNRFFARSRDGGETWIDAWRSGELPDGPKSSSYGCMGGMIRLPVTGRDILLTSNLDTDSGRMPDQLGGSVTKGRERLTVWASFDGGRTWPVKRLVCPGPSGYSNLAVGRPGTPSAGRVFLLFEAGPKGAERTIQVAVFNLAWLLDGRDPAAFLAAPAAP
jgi:arylsulfatase A-like enzyme/lysophospholipase L1-like esterase